MNKALLELAEIHYGKSPKGIRVDSSSYPIFGTGGQVGYAVKPLFKAPGIVVGRKGTLGNPIFSPDDFWAIDTTYAVLPKSAVEAKWIYYNLLNFDLTKLNEATGVPSINRDYLYQIKFCYFELEGQRKIAEILSTVDDAIEQTEALIRKHQRIKQGLMQNLLTRGVDENGELRDSFEINPCLYNKSEFGFFPKHWDLMEIENKLHRVIDYRGKTPRKASDGIPLITAKNVRVGYLDPEPREYIYSADYNSWMNRGIPNEGDVFFTTEAPLGNVARVPGYQHAVGQRIITLQPKPDELESSFLFWLLLAPLSRQRIQQKSTGSTAVGIKSSVFIKIPFPFPPISEQKRISQILDQAQCIVLEEESKLVKLKLLKRGLMQDLLTGKVRVNTLLER